MAIKTVIKLLLSKYAPLSVDMQRAVISDQAIINDANTLDVSYSDNTEVAIDKEVERVKLMLSDCKTQADVDTLQEQMPDVDIELFALRKEEILNGK
jgi:recombination protein RecT